MHSLLALAVSLAPAPPLLTFSGLLQDAGGHLVSTRKLLDASGHRVRMQGFVAQMEIAPKGGFWLCPRPVQGDESGGGTADLPLESVFVVVRSSPNTIFPSPKRAVSVSGVLEVGPKALTDGTMTHLRLVLDRAAPKPSLPSRAKARPVRSASPEKP